MSEATILVTGGAGFIGSHLVENLLAQAYQVRVLDNFSSGHRYNLPLDHPHLTVLEGDVGDFTAVQAAASGVKAIFHEAALVSVPRSIEQPQASFHSNSLGSFNVLEAARRNQVERVIFASSAAVYGANDALPLAETAPVNPLSPYALEKYHTECLAALYRRLYGLNSVGLRYFNVYGPRQDPHSAYSGVMSIFCERLRRGQALCIFGDGEQTRDFVYVGDVVNANLRALTAPAGAWVFNVGTGQQTSLNQLLAQLQTALQTHQSPQYQAARAGDIRHSCAEISALKQQLAWQPHWSLTEGLAAYLAWQTANEVNYPQANGGI